MNDHNILIYIVSDDEKSTGLETIYLFLT